MRPALKRLSGPPVAPRRWLWRVRSPVEATDETPGVLQWSSRPAAAATGLTVDTALGEHWNEESRQRAARGPRLA
jgi:hypothetical protein